MKEGFREQIPTPEEPRWKEAFEDYFSDGEILDAVLVELPDVVQEKFEQMAIRYMDISRYEAGDFHDVQAVRHGPKETTYVARKIKDYRDAGTEESTFLVDVVEEKVVGYGEVRYHLTDEQPYFKDKPFVGFTQTDYERRRAGLAERRLRIMNALARQKYGLPIYSDTVISEEAQALWEKLVKEGRARKFKEGKHDRYVFDDVS